jgi:queuine/archaeosine tRNA-ribosyltransferase
MKRKATISHGDFELNLPLFFPSISSVKTNFTILDYLKLIDVSAAKNFLISAYDIFNQENTEKQKIIGILKELKENGINILMDSGNYESYWHKDSNWTISKYESILKQGLANIYFSFDDQNIKGKSISQITNTVVENSKSNMTYTDSLITPIIHAQPNQLKDVCKEVVKKLNSTHIAIPERLLGDGIINRVVNLKLIREELNSLGRYISIHLLGTGSPFSILLFVWAGADTFDGLEWCQTSIDPLTFQTYHFQLRELYHIDNERNNYSLMTLYNNLQFFDNLNFSIQKALEQNELIKILKEYFSPELLKALKCQ